MMALALAFIVSAGAQDRIYFNDSRIVNAVIDQVGSRYIKYRLYSSLSRATSISRALLMITIHDMQEKNP